MLPRIHHLLGQCSKFIGFMGSLCYWRLSHEFLELASIWEIHLSTLENCNRFRSPRFRMDRLFIYILFLFRLIAHYTRHKIIQVHCLVISLFVLLLWKNSM